MRIQLIRSIRASAAVLGVAVLVGCAHGRQPGSYLPIGASAWYGDRTEDGVTLLLYMEPGVAMERVGDALRSAGYEVERPTDDRRTLRTAARPLGGDTTMVVTAQVSLVELPEVASVVVLTATYDVPSRRLRRAPVIQRPGETSPLYGRLGTIADVLRTPRTPVP